MLSCGLSSRRMMVKDQGVFRSSPWGHLGIKQQRQYVRAVVCQAASQKPTLHYLPIRGRAEVIRLAMAAAGEDWEEVHYGSFDEKAGGIANLNWGPEIKQNEDLFPFFQAPSLTVGGETYPQSTAILRYLGRTHGMYGTSEHETLWVDAIIDAVQDLWRPWAMLMYIDIFKLDGLDKYWTTRGNPDSIAGFNMGGHLEFMSRVLKRTKGSKGYAVGDTLTIADIALFDVIDAHLQVFPEQLPQQHLELAKHHAMVKAQKGIDSYLASPRRCQWTLGTNLLKDGALQVDNIAMKQKAVNEFLAMQAQQ